MVGVEDPVDEVGDVLDVHGFVGEAGLPEVAGALVHVELQGQVSVEVGECGSLSPGFLVLLEVFHCVAQGRQVLIELIFYLFMGFVYELRVLPTILY